MKSFSLLQDDSLLLKLLHFNLTEKVAHYKKLQGGVIFINEVPKSPSGKILRRKLKEMTLEILFNIVKGRNVQNSKIK